MLRPRRAYVLISWECFLSSMHFKNWSVKDKRIRIFRWLQLICGAVLPILLSGIINLDVVFGGEPRAMGQENDIYIRTQYFQAHACTRLLRKKRSLWSAAVASLYHTFEVLNFETFTLWCHKKWTVFRLVLHEMRFQSHCVYLLLILLLGVDVYTIT